jgi:hypothetical protein
MAFSARKGIEYCGFLRPKYTATKKPFCSNPNATRPSSHHVDVTGPIESPIRRMSGKQEIIANR